MPLSDTQKRQLRTLSHTLKPVVMIGTNGLTDNVCEEINNALTFHELIKVRVSAVDHERRDAMIAEFCARTKCELVQRIGHIATVFRRNPQKQKIMLGR